MASKNVTGDMFDSSQNRDRSQMLVDITQHSTYVSSDDTVQKCFVPYCINNCICISTSVFGNCGLRQFSVMFSKFSLVSVLAVSVFQSLNE